MTWQQYRKRLQRLKSQVQSLLLKGPVGINTNNTSKWDSNDTQMNNKLCWKQCSQTSQLEYSSYSRWVQIWRWKQIMNNIQCHIWGVQATVSVGIKYVTKEGSLPFSPFSHSGHTCSAWGGKPMTCTKFFRLLIQSFDMPTAKLIIAFKKNFTWHNQSSMTKPEYHAILSLFSLAVTFVVTYNTRYSPADLCPDTNLHSGPLGGSLRY